MRLSYETHKVDEFKGVLGLLQLLAQNQNESLQAWLHEGMAQQSRNTLSELVDLVEV